MNTKVIQAFRIPSLVLAAVLQFMPMVRAALPAMQSASNLFAIIFRWGGAAAAALGGVQAVSGASTVITLGNVTATNDVAVTNKLLTSPQTASYWEATGLPPGIALVGVSGNASWKLQGTPTTTGTYSVALTAKSKASANASETTTKTVVYTVVANSGGGGGGGASNSPPVATAQSVSTAEDTAKAVTLTATDANGNPLTYAIVSTPTHGMLTGGAPNVTYTPEANYNGADGFTFRANDGFTNSAAATVTITVTAVNDAPVADAQSVTTPEDTAKAITLTATDADGNALTYAIVASPAHGTLTGTGANRTYTPAANYNGADSFTFKANDGAVDSATATVSITVTAVNDAPVATTQSVATDKNVAKNITLAGTDADGNALTFIIVAQPTKGVLSGVVPNLTYTPNNNVTGSDSFTFKVNDGTVDSATAVVAITIAAGANTAPVATAQSVTTGEDTAKAVMLSGTDANGDALAYTVVTPPTHGTLGGTAPGLTYTPAANYNGSDSFTFKANDGTVDSATSTVSITVTAVNDPPVAAAQSVATDKNVAKNINLAGTDVDGNALTFTIVTQPTKGALSGTAPSLTFTPNNNVTGADSFTFKVNDGTAMSAVATVSITIAAGPNTAPVAYAQSVATAEDTAKAITLAGTDADGDPLTYVVVSAPSHGNLTGTAPNVTYTPTANYNGTDSFTFKVNDGTVDSAGATVTFTVTTVNDAPVAGAQSVSTPQDTTKAITLSGSDVDVDALTYHVTIQPAHGSLSGTTPNLAYTPAAGYKGADSFAFKVNDGTVDSSSVTVSINVTAVNHPPVVSAQSVTTAEDAAKTITLQGADPDGDALGVVVTAQPAHGTLVGAPPNLAYTPAANYSGADSFSFTARDGTAASSPAMVSITVTPVNDAPTLNALANITATQNAGSQTAALSGIGAGPGESQTLSITASSSNPSLIPTPTVTYASPSATGSLSFMPIANTTGTAVITVTVNDGGTENNTVSRSFTVTVEAINTPISMDLIPDMTLAESAPEQTVTLTGIHTTTQVGSGTTVSHAGLAPWLQALINRLAQTTPATLTVTAASSDTTLIPTPTVMYSSPSSTGTLHFQPASNASGVATLTVTVADGKNPPLTRGFKVSMAATTNIGDPTIVLTAPAMNASYSAPATITLSASVKANGHAIAKVQFFAGANLVAEDTSVPYSADWECKESGHSSLVARALYESNGVVDSPAAIVTVADLPAPWETMDIGSVAILGSVIAGEDGFEIAGAGTLASNSDSFRFLYQTLSADGEVRVRVNTVGLTGSDARVGIMIRENLTSSSRFAFLGVSPDGILHWQSRETTDSSTSDQSNSGGSLPVWIRLVRRGDLIIGLRSTNGTSWVPVGMMNLPMASNIYVGVAVASGNVGMLNASSVSSPAVMP